VEKIYSKYAIELQQICDENHKSKSGRIQSLFARLEKDLKEKAPTEVVFKDRFKSLAYKNSEEGRRLIKYVLAKINRHFDQTGEQKIDFNAVDCEHILPQRPDKEWKLSKKDIKPYVHRLGNLTLLWKPINGKVQNFIIPKKIVFLAESKLPITQKLVEQLKAIGETWNEAEINRRHEDFAEIAFKQIWKF
jgi:hypothetical protein